MANNIYIVYELVRLNREIRPHPSMTDLVATLNVISNEYVRDLRLIQSGRMRPPPHQPVRVHDIPDDYRTFNPSGIQSHRTID